MKRALPLATLLGLLAAAPPTHAEEAAFDRVVAVVGTAKVITQSDVDLVARLQRVRAGQLDKLDAPVPSSARKAAVAYLVFQALVYEEASRYGIQNQTEEEVETALATLRQRFPKPEAWRAFLAANEATVRDISEILRRHLVATRFASDQVRLNVRITEAEIKEWIARHPADPAVAGRGPEAAREAAEHALTETRLEAERQRWIEGLRKRVRVRMLVTYR